MKRGTATVSADELRQAVRSGAGGSRPEDTGPADPPIDAMGHILTRAELVDRVRADRAAGLTIAFANGCFDLLHVGHSAISRRLPPRRTA